MSQKKENKEGIDLSEVFKDSDKGVKFQNKGEQRPAQTFFPGTPKIIQWVIKYSGGLIKNENQAAYVIFGFVAVAVIITLVLVFSPNGEQTTPPVEQYIDKPQFLPNQ